MHASALTPDQERELRALRARAYGPEADIDSDPTAVARLRELEAYGHLEAVADVDAAPPRPAPSSIETAVPVGTDASAPDEPPREGADAPARVGRLRAVARGVPAAAWIVAASTVVLVLTAVWGVAQVTAPNSDLSLAEIDSDPVPPPLIADNYFTTLYGVTTDDMRVHESFRTITPWSWTGIDGTRCLFLTVEGFDRFTDGACTPPGIDPIAHITVWPGLSEELIGDLPQGSVIRFALHDRRVHVWVRAANAPS